MHIQTLNAVYSCLLHTHIEIATRLKESKSFVSVLPEPAVFQNDSWAVIRECLYPQNSSAFSPSHPFYLVRMAESLLSDSTPPNHAFASQWDAPLYSIFSHMNGEHIGYTVPVASEQAIPYPINKENRISPSHYAKANQAIQNVLTEIKPDSQHLDILLEALEEETGNLPAKALAGVQSDVSLFDSVKLAAAFVSCISEYLLEQNQADYRSCLSEQKFRDVPYFLLYSADLSGIQKFIFTVSDSKALRSLRSRSFFLGMLMEYYLDELLRCCGLSRVNLLYSGGGHCYLLLPNTPEIAEKISSWNLKFNNFLIKEFGAALYLGHGFTPCCGNEFLNVPAEKHPYREMFRRVSAQISAQKLCRYSAEQILQLNDDSESDGRECKICGRTDNLEKDLCPWCQTFINLSQKIQNSDVYIVCRGLTSNFDFTLPTADGTANILFTNEADASRLMESDTEVYHVYKKNKCRTRFRYSTKVYVGDYAYSNSMNELAGQSNGVKRIAVCRMDVDNLGQSFVRGFEVPGADTPEKQYQYVSLSRTSAFSRQLSLFFQKYINDILSGTPENKKSLSVTIVYSGGDDVFLVGAWNDILEASNRIQEALQKFTCGSLTISGGISLFPVNFPIRVSAERTAELEDRAKQEPQKNSICLFDAHQRHVYSWDVYREKVLKEKLLALSRFFEVFPEHGNAMLYSLMSLLRPNADEEKGINFARYVYQLARLEPPKQDKQRWIEYKSFADNMYRWGWNGQDRLQLITAIYLYVYQNRGTDYE